MKNRRKLIWRNLVYNIFEIALAIILPVIVTIAMFNRLEQLRVISYEESTNVKCNESQRILTRYLEDGSWELFCGDSHE